MVKIFWEFFPLPFFFLFTILIKEPKHIHKESCCGGGEGGAVTLFFIFPL